MTLVIAGERSGVGKTTITLALLAYLQRQSDRVQSFKVGPDYIDPMFHSYVTGRACRNLDPVLTSERYVQQCFARHVQNAEYALVEGVMGLFDGATGAEDVGSTAHVARLLNLPVLLVLDCSRMSRSVAAIAHGYRSFDPRVNMTGVILNRVGSDRHLDLLKAALEPLNLPILGVLRRQDDITIPDRHLGLIPTAELPELKAVCDRLAALAETCFDWSRLLEMLKGGENRNGEDNANTSEMERPVTLNPPFFTSNPPFFTSNPALFTSKSALVNSSLSQPVRIAVARDRAFSFYYADNLDILESLGAELVFWSPLQDEALPEQVDGLYFGGGFPEVFAAELSANQTAQRSVRAAIQSGMPAYAECGGLMYLSQGITNFEGQTWEMVGVLPTIAKMGARLTLGYRRAIALQTSPLLPIGTTVWGHEFHRSHLAIDPAAPLYQTQGYDAHTPLATEGWQVNQLHASYVHLHWGSREEVPARFLQACCQHQVSLTTAGGQH